MFDIAVPQDETMSTLQSEWKNLSIELLNDIFEPIQPEERLRLLYKYFSAEEILMTSSFGTKSAVLLSMVSQIEPLQPIYFIDTTYHFGETLGYRDQLVQQLGLKIINVLPNQKENELTRQEQWWKDYPKMCCNINKVAPLEPIKAKHKIWISGVMAYQTKFRSNLRIFDQQGDIIKFHPLIDLKKEEFEDYFERFNLPRHPLQSQGYGSIGCMHCTQKGEGREGRWKGTNKTECGLHPSYFANKKKGIKTPVPDPCL